MPTAGDANHDRADGHLAAFIVVTAASGTLFVVLDLRMDWIEGGPFTDCTVPAIALGFVGLLAIMTTLALVIRPEVAGVAAMTTGAAMVAFELVEIPVVGFSPIEHGVGEPMAWPQVVYIAIGLVAAGMGGASRAATADDRRGRDPTSAHAPPWSVWRSRGDGAAARAAGPERRSVA